MAQSIRKCEQGSGIIAKDRLKAVLLGDRLNCSPETVEKIKHDILAVMEKYLDCGQFDVMVSVDVAVHEKQEEKYDKAIQIKGL